MVTDGSCSCEHSIKYREVESLCCTPKTNVALCVSHTEKKIWSLSFFAQLNVPTLPIFVINPSGWREYNPRNKTHAPCRASSRRPAYTYAQLPRAHVPSLWHLSLWKRLQGWGLENQNIGLLKGYGSQAPNGIWELCTQAVEKQGCWKKGWWLCRQLKCILHNTSISPQC